MLFCRAENWSADPRIDSHHKPAYITTICKTENPLEIKACNKKHVQEIDNSNTVLERISSLNAQHLQSDITLEVSGRHFAAHRLILCASSDVFQVMLMNSAWKESQETTICLQEDPACVVVFPDFLKYLNTGRIHINISLVLPLMTLADKYNLKDLTQLCEDYMCKHVVFAYKQNQLISWLSYARTNSCNTVYDACLNFITWNFDLMCDFDDFFTLGERTFFTIIKRSDLVVRNEVAVFHCVSKWLEIQETKLKVIYDEIESQCYFLNLLALVMSYVRFPMMSCEQLDALQNHPLISRSKDFFMERRMEITVAFHSDQNDERVLYILNEDDGSLIFTPRLYTADKWSASLCIENYTTFPIYGVEILDFETPINSAEIYSNYCIKWTVEFNPKGVGYYMFRYEPGVTNPGQELMKCVCLSVSTELENGTEAEVSVGILVCGTQDGIKHICKVICKEFVFSSTNSLLTIEDIVPYDELNGVHWGQSSYLTGPNADCLELYIVITPCFRFQIV